MMAKVMGCGACAGFYQGDTQKLLDDIQALRPTFFPSVPRLLTRVYDKIFANVDNASFIKQKIFEMACNAKKKRLHHGSVSHWLWDPLVFKKLRNALGGRVRIILTASAPLSTDGEGAPAGALGEGGERAAAPAPCLTGAGACGRLAQCSTSSATCSAAPCTRPTARRRPVPG